MIRPLKKEDSEKDISKEVSKLVSEFMNAGISFHKLHLKVAGPGSFAAHLALKEAYEAFPGFADTLAEGFQGASLSLLNIPDTECTVLGTVAEAVAYLTELYENICNLQSKLPYSEIINDLDVAKSLINSVRYKLTFLK